MTTTFLLIRHAAHDNVGGFLAGRGVDVCLGEHGREQARRLAKRMYRHRPDTLHSSPRRRTRETAAAIRAALGVEESVAPELDEIDFGESWCGRTFEELNQDPLWRRWNADRLHASTPAGETLRDVQDRIVGHIERVAGEMPEQAVALVTHADVIKVAVAHYLRLALDRIDLFDIAPASVSTLAVGDWGARLMGLNEVPA